jgi:hypothetical protein
MTRTGRILWIALLGVALAAAPAAAQQTPEGAAREYLRLFQAGDWRQAAALMHPDALEELKGFFSLVAEGDSAGVVLGPMFGVSGAAEFRALTAQEVYARVLGTVSRSAPQLVPAMRGMQAEVLGSVNEGPEVAHVVYRLSVTLDGVTSTKVQVLSFRRSGDRWMGLLSGDLRALAESISRASQRPR